MDWAYSEAFSRNIGLISMAEQEHLRRARVAIPGMGGVGGVHLMTLARLGVGNFSIADPDTFEVANFNRQYGATTSSVGCSKVQTMAERALEVNPELDLRVFEEAVTGDNVDRFLDGADLVLDGLDMCAVEARRVVFREAARRGLHAITAGPMGFSAAMLTFGPDGMSFDEYFDLYDGQDEISQILHFGIGLAPWPTHLPYTDLRHVSVEERRGPSVSVAINLCAAMAATEAVTILLEHGNPRCAPRYTQFDTRRGIYRRGVMPWGNRNPIQRLKLWLGRRRYL